MGEEPITPTRATHRTRWLVRTVGILGTVSVLGAIGTAVSYWSERDRKIETATESAVTETQRAVEQIDRQLKALETVVEELAEDLNTGRLSQEDLDDRLETQLEKNENLSSVGVAYAPYGYNAETRLYAPVYKRVSDPDRPNRERFQRFNVEDTYDYTQPHIAWFNDPLNGGAQWADPYLGRVLQQLLAEYSVPFATPETSSPTPDPNGIVYANYDFKQLKTLMESLALGKTGYGFVVSQSGKFVYHPVDAVVKERRSIFDLSEHWNAPQFEELAEAMLAGERGAIQLTPKGRASAWVVYEPIPSTEWSLAVVLFRDEVFQNTRSLDRKLIWLTLFVVASLVFGSVVAIRPDGDRIHRLWGLVVVVSVFLSGGIGAIWGLEMSQTSLDNDTGIKIANPARLQKFLAEQTRRAQAAGDTPPVFVPTGVFLQSLEFSDANDVFVTGYVWQRYLDGVHDEISRGFVLPEAVSPSVRESYRQEFDGGVLIGWYVEAQLRQPFDYSKYPFDRKDVWMRLWHEDFTSNVVLTPDLAAYDILSPTTLPGLEMGENFVMPGWILEQSFFQYKLNSYNTGFGFRGETQLKNFPELYFDVVMRRDFLTVFITKMMRTIVVAVLLFGVQTIIRFKVEDDELGFSASGVISAAGAFTFILILDQINLRSSLATGGILYIEYFYFVLYVMILFVAIDGLLVAKRSNAFLLRYRNNLIPKLLYWPVLLTLQLLVTALVFC
ncbi:cache domain-containing protein [Geitlerinema sp. CS-897]|nr:cache domain-containing protein [Geitlerinema sp. CS-897]